MAKGDIVLITFPFTDLSGSKLRPALVLAESKADLTVCFITQTEWIKKSDLLIFPDPENGLKAESLIRTGKVACLERSLAKGLLGRLS